MKLNKKTLADVEIGIPVLAEGKYHARIEKPLVKPNKRGDGNNLVILFRILDNPVMSFHDAKELVNQGQCCIQRYFSLVPTDTYDPDKAMKELAVAIGLPEEQDLNVEDLARKVVMIQVKHKDAEGAFPEGNDVARVTPVPAEDNFQPPPF